MAGRRARILRVAWWGTTLVVAGLLASSLAAMVALARVHGRAVEGARAELAALADAHHLHELLYQKGLVGEYFLTGDEQWLEALEREQAPFTAWLARTRGSTLSVGSRAVVSAIESEYEAYDRDRDRSIALLKRGERERALELRAETRVRAKRLRELADGLLEARRHEVDRALAAVDAEFSEARRLLIALGIAALAAALTLGFLFARRVARPLYELVLRTESSGGARVEVHAEDEVAAIGAHVARLAREVEEASRRVAEERARAAQAEKMSALGEMATAIAHEVLNPLAGIKVALQLLDRLEQSEHVRETVSAVNAEIARVDRIARRLIAFARPLAPSPRACDLSVLVRRALEAVEREGARREISLVTEVGSEPIRADPDLLEQVLVNLARNACEAIPGKGSVRVRAGHGDGFRSIEVIDDGAGIPPEVAAKLFTPFVTSKPEGHGLGLALSQSIALAHGGRIEARSNSPRPGSTFVVYLPEAA